MAGRQQKLMNELIALSVNDNWDDVSEEWDYSYTTHGNDYCLCGQSIKRLFYIRNTTTNELALVGCVCVEKFVNRGLGKLCARIGRTLDHIENDEYYRARDNDMVIHCHDNEVINDWEYNFLSSIGHKKALDLSLRQRNTLKDINIKMVAHMTTPT